MLHTRVIFCWPPIITTILTEKRLIMRRTIKAIKDLTNKRIGIVTIIIIVILGVVALFYLFNYYNYNAPSATNVAVPLESPAPNPSEQI